MKSGRGVRQGSCLLPILSNLYSKYFTKEALEAFGDLKIIEQVICTVKYVEDLVLMTKEEMVLLGMTDRLTEIGRFYGMEIMWRKLT